MFYHSFLKLIARLNKQEFQNITKEKIEKGFDQPLIDILSSFPSYKDKVMDTLIEEWAAENNIKPTQEIGDKVIVSYKGNRYVGEITGFLNKYAQYMVLTTEFNDDIQVNYEDVKPVSESFKTKL